MLSVIQQIQLNVEHNTIHTETLYGV